MWNKNEILQQIGNEIYHCSQHNANLFLLQHPFVFQRIKTNLAINKKINKYEKENEILQRIGNEIYHCSHCFR